MKNRFSCGTDSYLFRLIRIHIFIYPDVVKVKWVCQACRQVVVIEHELQDDPAQNQTDGRGLGQQRDSKACLKVSILA
jgi:hypothetical protein